MVAVPTTCRSRLIRRALACLLMAALPAAGDAGAEKNMIPNGDLENLSGSSGED